MTCSMFILFCLSYRHREQEELTVLLCPPSHPQPASLSEPRVGQRHVREEGQGETELDAICLFGFNHPS